MKVMFMLILFLFGSIKSISMEEKRGIFATNIENYIKKDLILPSGTDYLVGRTKTDITILFQGTRISDISKVQKKYGLSNGMVDQIKAAQFASGSNIYSKLEESVVLGTGSLSDSVGAAFRDKDWVYFALIRGISKATLRIKYERVCHESCSTFLIFFEDCDTICNDVSVPYTNQEINTITKYIKYYSAQALLGHLEILKKSGYQTYLTDGNGIYSEDGNYVAYVTDFGDIAIGPVKDVAVVQSVSTLELIDNGTRDYQLRGGTTTGRRGTTDSGRTGRGGSRGSVGRALEERNVRGAARGTSTRTSSTRSGGSSSFSGEGTIVTRGIRGSSSLSIKNQCYPVEVTTTTTEGGRGTFGGRRLTTVNKCFDYYDGNFQLFNFIGNGINGGLSKEDALKRMFDGRQNGGDYHLIILNDGNLVLYNGENVLWQTNTANQGIGPFDIKVTNDRYLILEDSTGKVLYKSGTIKEYNILKRSYCTYSRLYNPSHDITIGVVNSQCKEEGKWKILTSHEDNTKEIFRCYVNGSEVKYNHYMLSLDSNCEGQTKNGSLGWVYNTQVPGSFPIYRCRIDNDHFVSSSSNCEGHITEFVIGYVLPA